MDSLRVSDKGRNGMRGNRGLSIYRQPPMNYPCEVNPYVKGQNRGAERIVIGDDGSVWYTNNHYYTFTRIE